MNGGYTGTSKRMVPNKLPGSGKPIEFTGYWKSLRTCSKCGKKMWENGSNTRCICELQHKVEIKEIKAMPKTLKERVIELYNAEFTADYDNLSFAADEISARIGGTSSIVVLSIIREKFGIKAKKPKKSHNLREVKKGSPGRKSGYTAEELQTIVDMHNAGSNDDNIGAAVGRSAGTVSVKLSALRKQGIIKCRSTIKHNESVSLDIPEEIGKNAMERGKAIEKANDILMGRETPLVDLKDPIVGGYKLNQYQPVPSFEAAAAELKKLSEEDIANMQVTLCKPTLGQFIDLAAECGYGLESAGINGAGRMEINFMEGGE